MFVGAFTRSPPWPAMVIASSSFCLGVLRARKADGTTRWPSLKTVTEKSPRAKILGFVVSATPNVLPSAPAAMAAAEDARNLRREGGLTPSNLCSVPPTLRLAIVMVFHFC
jgi:hypothetical protein